MDRAFFATDVLKIITLLLIFFPRHTRRMIYMIGVLAVSLELVKYHDLPLWLLKQDVLLCIQVSGGMAASYD